MNKVKERISKNIFTTIIGISFIISCFVAVFIGKTTLLEATPIILLGVSLVLSKDTIINKILSK